MTLGEKLKKLRREKRMTIDQTAAAIGVSRRAYITYEQNDAKPRKRETYQKIADTLGCDVNYLLMEDYSGIATLAKVVGGNSLIPFGSMASAVTLYFLSIMLALNKDYRNRDDDGERKLLYDNEALEQYDKKQKRFSAMATGIIYKVLASKGIIFQVGDPQNIGIDGGIQDEYIILKENGIKNWWFIFWSKDKEFDKSGVISAEDRAGAIFSRLVTVKSDPERKVSIVVDDIELFNAVKQLSSHNSYRGYATVILFDVEGVSVKDEAVISTYYDNESGDVLPLV